jgi:hypothetical protein
MQDGFQENTDVNSRESANLSKEKRRGGFKFDATAGPIRHRNTTHIAGWDVANIEKQPTFRKVARKPKTTQAPFF